MPFDKQANRNQSEHRHECTENFDEESDDGGDELRNDSDESEVPNDIQSDSDGSEGDTATEQDSGDESETSYAVTEDTSEEEPPKRRFRREEEVQRPECETFIARSGRRWTTEEPAKRKLPLANIIRQRNGIGRQAAHIQTVKEAFQLFMTPDMIYLLVRETNRHARLVMKQWNDKNPGKERQWSETDGDEILAFIGLLTLAGVHRSKNEDLNDLWSIVNGRPIFRAPCQKIDSKACFNFADLTTKVLEKIG